MIEDWNKRFAEHIVNYEGYSLGKQLDLLKDPQIISLAIGLPSPDIFQKDEMRAASQLRLKEDIEAIMQYSPVRGETTFLKAIIQFLKRDHITVSEQNILVTSSGQHGLDMPYPNPGSSC